MIILWFKPNVLRLEDNLALNEAIKTGQSILPIYVDYENEKAKWKIQGASAWYLHKALEDLQASLRKYGSALILQKGNPADIFLKVAQTENLQGVYWNTSYEPFDCKQDVHIQKVLTQQNIQVKTFNSSLLYEPRDIKNRLGNPFQVFTPFWKECTKKTPLQPITGNLSAIKSPKKWPSSLKIEDFNLLPAIPWHKKLETLWTPTQAKAKTKLTEFIQNSLSTYAEDRDRPYIEGTSTLSCYLRFGQIGPRQVWQAIQNANTQSTIRYLTEIGWREFAYHLLYHFPHTTDFPLREKYQKMPWAPDATLLQKWQKGLTGYPIVDAGMRQLYQTGWMHNRVRMIVGSFLVKHLLQPWQSGAKWFWDTLVDADLASNTLGWQWVAGSGADASPFFRIFNPILQGEKFDPEGIYVKKYLPSLSKLPTMYIHKPWEASNCILNHAGVALGKNYPFPIVDHAKARIKALNALKQIS